MLAWGIVPVGEETILSESKEHLREKLEEGMELLVKAGIDKRRRVERSIITPCCTTATLSVERAEEVFDYTQRFSQEMKRKYFLEGANCQRREDGLFPGF